MEIKTGTDIIKNFFSEDGLLAEKFTGYEYRQSQEEMAFAVFDTLKSRRHIFIEAPTGVGKSYAYLVPAIHYAKENKKRAIISTYTINLQEQLIHKDIPLLKEILPIEFKAKIFKGRSNYLCPNRLQKAMLTADTLFDSKEKSILDKIYQWSLQTEDGTLSDMDFEVDHDVWNSVFAEKGICTTKTCSGAGTKCFFQKAKKELADSDVIVINHHLFFTLFDGINEDREGYLYHNDFVIFDEAHTVEQVATDHISPFLSREMFKYHLLKLYNQNKKRGFLATLPALHIIPVIQNLLDLNQIFFQDIKRKLFNPENGKLDRLTSRVYDKNIAENIIKAELDNLLGSLRKLRQACQDEWQLNELNEYIVKFNEFFHTIDDFLQQKYNKKDNEHVYWVELASQKPEANISICSSPVDISDYFRQHIFRPLNSTISTSATLTINNNFEYFKKRLGAEAADELKLESPFDFYRQVKIFIPKNISPPDKKLNDIYNDDLKYWIHHFVRETNGKALVLFTNSFLMKKIGKELEVDLNEEGIELFIQGTGTSRKILLEMFKENINSVLFGLDSFWMGVDVPGEALSNLIITKLPFPVPTHPITQAKMEFIDKNGGNSFFEYSLPEAILKFRQGIGRLIRSKNDYGVIAILDNRIINKSYGKYFLNSLEECPVEIIE
jgi:ATP-dependent DNA helicase DinG